MTIFYTIRHGESDWNRFQEAQLDGRDRNLVSLTLKGINQIETAARDPRLRNAELILSSPYTRAMHSAAILHKVLSIPMEVEYLLHEWQPEREYKLPLQDYIDDVVWDKMNSTYEKADSDTWETLSEVSNRVKAVLNKYLSLKSVIVVSHFGVLKSLTNRELISNGEIVEFEI